MVWPWTLTFWPKNVIRSSVSQDAPVTKVWRKSVNTYWRYRGNIKLPRESRTDGRTHGRTTRKHTASAGAYRRRRLKKQHSNFWLFQIVFSTKKQAAEGWLYGNISVTPSIYEQRDRLKLATMFGKIHQCIPEIPAKQTLKMAFGHAVTLTFDL